jgi:hypothetical protein
MLFGVEQFLLVIVGIDTLTMSLMQENGFFLQRTPGR